MTEESTRYDDLEPVDYTGTTTLDLYDRVDHLIDVAIPDVKDAIEEAERALDRGTHPEWAAADDGRLTPEEMQYIRQRVAGLEEEKGRYEYFAGLFHSCAEDWGGSAFEVKRNLGFHEVQAAKDDIQSMTVQSGQDLETAQAKDGAYKLKVLQFGVVDAPPEAPPVTADEFPWQVGEWLYEQFDAINSRGGESLGNSSSAPRPEAEVPQSE